MVARCHLPFHCDIHAVMRRIVNHNFTNQAMTVRDQGHISIRETLAASWTGSWLAIRQCHRCTLKGTQTSVISIASDEEHLQDA